MPLVSMDHKFVDRGRDIRAIEFDSESHFSVSYDRQSLSLQFGKQSHIKSDTDVSMSPCLYGYAQPEDCIASSSLAQHA